MNKMVPFCLLFLLTFVANSQIINDHRYETYEKKSFSSKMNFKASAETNNYDIIYHRILWDVDPAIYYIKGSVTSYFKASKNNMTTVCFDLIDALSVDSINSKGNNLAYTHSNNLLKITLPKTLNFGDVDSLTISYQGAPQSLTGFGSFETSLHNQTPVLWTLSEPYGAKEWWPCKQSLTDKIDSIDIYVKAPKAYKVGSNGKLIYEKESGSTKLTYWKHRYPIATYLVAIAVTNYESYSHLAKVDEINTVEIVNYVYPEDRSWAEPSTEFTVKVMELFSTLFIPYPFYKEKYGHAQFGWSGGMEHQTMSFMGGFSKSLITHELAHQWFGDHVTCGSWQHIWINEGFAVFCEYVAQEHLYPESWINWKKNKMDEFLPNIKSGSVFCEDTTSVNRIFNGPLTYQKGGAIIQLLKNQIGDGPFYDGIKKMLSNEKTRGGFAIADDVRLFLEDAADTNLNSFFSDWYYGQGYPEYQLNWEQDLDLSIKLKIRQTTTHESVPFFKLKVPILLKNSTHELLTIVFNTENNQTFTINPGFEVNEIIFDPNYDIIATHPAITTVGIQETLLQSSISIYPNPSMKNISVIALNNTVLLKYDVLDNTGKHILNSSQAKNTHKIDVDISNYPSGVYYIRVDTNVGLVVKKFIKYN